MDKKNNCNTFVKTILQINNTDKQIFSNKTNTLANLDLLYFKQLKAEIQAEYLKNNSPSEEDISKWKGIDIIYFQEDLRKRAKGNISEKTFYTYFKTPNIDKLPRIDMLNLLSIYAGYESWFDFKKQHSSEDKEITNNTTENLEQKPILQKNNIVNQEYKEKNGVIIKGNFKDGLADGLQERYYPSGKLYGKINIINNKVEGTETTYYENGKTISELNYTQGKLISGKVYYENGDLLSKIEGKKITIFYSSGKKLFSMDKTNIAVYHENGKEAFSNSAEGIKINGEPAKKSLLDMFSKENLVKTALYLLTSDTIQAEYKSGKPSIQLKGTTAVMYYPSGKILLELSPSIDGTVNSKIYYENGQLMQVEDRSKHARSVKVYDKAGNLIAENIFNKEHEIKQIY